MLESLVLAKNYSVEIQVFLVIFATLLANYFANKTLDVFARKAEKTESIWDDAVVDAVKKPAKIFIFFLGFSYLVQILSSSFELKLIDALDSIRNILIIYAVTHFVLRLIRKSEEIYIEGHKYDPEKVTTVNAVVKLLKISVIITATLILMQTLGINISGVLAFGGVSGIAVGFAAKDLLANFFGALMIYLDKPFKIGDWIRSSDREIEGIVESIGWRQTRIRNFDKRPIYVPNSVFSTIAVENPSRMSHRRINEVIGVRYDDYDKVKFLVEEIRAYIEKHPKVDKDQILVVNFDRYADSALEIKVLCLINETSGMEFAKIKEEILFKIGDIIAKHKADIAYPTMTIKKSV